MLASSSGEDSTTATTTRTTGISESATVGPSTSLTTTSSTASTDTTLDTSTSDPTDASDSSSSGTPCPLGTEGCICDEGSCDEGLECTRDQCVPTSGCDVDLLEPNDEEDAPTLLGELSDDDDKGGSIFGTLNGPEDVDWYRYTGDDDAFSFVDPSRFVDATAGVRFCKFAECENGLDNTEFPCPDGTEQATSPAGRPGCCAPLGMEIGDANCSGVVEDNMFIYMRVDQGEEACVDYQLIYHF